MSERSYLSYVNPARWFHRRPTVGVVRLAGAIGLPSPLRNRGLSISSLAGPLERAFALKNLRAVALAINSPGGSAVQSSLIAKRIHTAGARKAMLDPFRAERPEDVARLAQLQQEIHDNFKAQVRERRGTHLKGGEADLFSGDVWTARSALALGLIDGIGDLGSILRGRYGDEVKLISVTPQRGWLRRRLGLEQPGGWAEQMLAAFEER